MGLGLDRMVMLLKGLPDIRLLRGRDPRVAAQMHDLTPWVPVDLPSRTARVTIDVGRKIDDRAVGDAIRTLLGEEQGQVSKASVVDQSSLPDGRWRAVVELKVCNVDGSTAPDATHVLAGRLAHTIDAGMA
jgi:phenylalanyl-tRNA synthetase alpha chain